MTADNMTLEDIIEVYCTPGSPYHWVVQQGNLHRMLVEVRNSIDNWRVQGICGAVNNHLFSDPAVPLHKYDAYIEAVKHVRQALFMSWPHYSGHPHYPVPGPEDAPDPYCAFFTRPKWEGEYGAMRRELLDHCIAVLENLTQ